MNEYERYGDYTEQQRKFSQGADTGSALKFLLLGMGIGAAVALLFAPMKGSELRNTIQRTCSNAFDGISEQTRNLRDRGSNLLGFSRRRAVGGEYETR